jgi:general secretion pathway protein I
MSGFGIRDSGFAGARAVPAVRTRLSRIANPKSRIPRGFTLVELVAAFVIFAIGFGVLLQILSTCLHTTAQSSDYTRVALWAQSLLDTQGVGETLKEGSYSGKFDERYRWQLNVQKMPSPEEPAAAAPAPGNALMPQVDMAPVGPNNIDLYQLELVVSWGGYYLTHNARFVTLRSQGPDPNNPANQVAQPTSSRMTRSAQ